MSNDEIRYYKVDSRKIRYSECWRICKKTSFFKAAAAKFFSIPIDIQMAIPRFENLTIVEPAKIPRHVQDAITPSLAECAQLDLKLQFVYRVPMLSQNLSFAAAMLNADGTIVSVVHYVQSPQRVVIAFNCFTKFSDGRLMGTSNHPKKFDSPSWSYPESMPGSSVKTIFMRHTERLKEMCVSCRVAIAPADLETVIVELIVRTIDEKIARKVFVPMSESEVENLKRKLGIVDS